MMTELYVRVRQENGTYEKVWVGGDAKAYPGMTRYYDCRKCGKRVAASDLFRDSRHGYCFEHIPRFNKMIAEPRTDITLY